MNNKTSNGTVLAIGELLWDVLPSGAVLGGAPANFAVRLATLDVPVVLVSKVGNDKLGQTACAELEELGVSTAFVQKDAKYPTGTVDVTLSASGNASYVINTGVAYDFMELNDSLLEQAKRCKVLCFGTLAQRSPASRGTIERLLEVASSAVKILDINLRRDCYSKETITQSLSKATVLKLNQDEIVALKPILGLKSESVKDLSEELIKKFGLRTILVTRAENGVFALDKDGTVVDVAGFKVKVVDTIGSGDAFTAGFVSRLLAGDPLSKCCSYGNKLGGLVAGTKGGMTRISVEAIDSFGQPASQ